MTALPRVSVVVVSHDRPAALTLCLTALRYLNYPEFEVVVAADAPGLAAVAQAGLSDAVKSVAVPDKGISAARNAGLALAAGEVVAFIDDDAVAEPSWLLHLIAPFADPLVAAAGGYVRGRNGISFQWTGRTVDQTARHSPLEITGNAPQVLTGSPHRAIKTEGTNMAFRRSVLARIGGFDSAYTYFLDETDVNMRLAQIGARTAIVPLAQVHHGFAPSAWRTQARAPRSLFDIGASSVVYWRKHAPERALAPAVAELRDHQRKRLLRHMVHGTLEPGQIAPLMATLEQGIAEGGVREIAELGPIPHPSAAFRPFPTYPDQPAVALAARRRHRKSLRAEAARRADAGQRVTLFLFSATGLFHHMRFHPGGWWEQTGGVFGRSDRGDRLLSATAFAPRLQREIDRLSEVRPMIGHHLPDVPEAQGKLG